MKLANLYEKDETAWLETMSRLIEAKRFDQLDYDNLASYLNDMALRDLREVNSRLVQLLLHLLKWTRQPSQRSKSWFDTISLQRLELQDLLKSKRLMAHAESVLAERYAKARQQALRETGLKEPELPVECPFTFEQLLADGWPKDLVWQPKRRNKK